MARFACDDLDAGDPFIFRFMGEHRTGNHIADGVDAFDICAEMFIDFDALPVIKLNANLFRAQTFGKRAAPN